MIRWNLEITTKLAYALSTVLILFLSSAFISLAHAEESVVTPPPPFGMHGSIAPAEGEQHINYDYARFRQHWAEMRASQVKYAERWEWRTSKYRLYEDYARWLRDHGYYDNDTPAKYPSTWYGPFPFAPVNLFTFVDMIIDIF